MARYVTSIRSPLSVEDAWRFMSDITLFPTWDPGVASAVQVTGDQPAAGSAYDLTIRGVVPTVMRYVITEFAPPGRLLMVSETRWLRSVDEIRVEADGAGSRVTYDAVLTLNGALGLFDPMLGLMFRVIGDRADRGLREALGARPA